MIQQELLDGFLSLPAEAQRQVLDFIAFLQQRYKSTQSTDRLPDTNLITNEFIGMWCDRQDLVESSIWVRNVRESEWSKFDG